MSPDEPLVMYRKMEIHFISNRGGKLGCTSKRGLGCASAAIFCIYDFRRSACKNSSPSQGYAQSGLTCKHVVLRNKTSGSSIGCWTCHHLKKNRAAPSAISIEYLSIKKFWHITSWCTIRRDTGTASKEQLVRLFTRLLKAVHVIDWSPWVADWWSNTNM